ncbi:carbon-nitrogen hydrolase family protein [Syntrophomonas erecta]
MGSTIKLGICQMQVGHNKEQNLQQAEKMIKSAASSGAEIIILPEVFNAPYQSDLFPHYAEPYPGPTTTCLSNWARQLGVCLVGGSIIERDENNLYNSSFIFSSDGSLLGRHRKIHLFDVNISGGVTFQESETLKAGNFPAIFQYKGITIGVIICFDIRFPELIRLMALQGVQLLVVPAAFNLTTGPAHWKLLMRCRAVDNQMYVAAASPARNPSASYQAWGHSMLVNPWGEVAAELDEKENIIITDIDVANTSRVRQELPILTQRRTDLYQLTWKNKA